MKQKQLEQALNRATKEVQEHVAAGHQAFLIGFNYLNVCGGFMGSFKADIPAFIKITQEHLLNLGVNVRGMQRDEWQYLVQYECEVPAPVEATKQCPMCAETIKAEAVICRFCGNSVA
jgi:hypothetical protein